MERIKVREGTMSDQQGGLSEAFIAQQRTRLEALRRELLGGEENTIADERTSQEEHGDEAEEFEDDAQGMAQDEINQSLRNVNDLRIADIQRALQKIDEGTYGRSDESGDPIPKARLEAMPEAIYTVEEQGRREAGK
jgi:DnaK suppressor protein